MVRQTRSMKKFVLLSIIGLLFGSLPVNILQAKTDESDGSSIVQGEYVEEFSQDALPVGGVSEQVAIPLEEEESDGAEAGESEGKESGTDNTSDRGILTWVNHLMQEHCLDMI